MSSPPAQPDAGDPASQPIFTDEILGEIFLRLDAAADLARASAACTAFLRVVRFLRRNRSLYCQPVVGFLYCKAWQDNSVSAEEWQHEKTIPILLPNSDRYSISLCGTGDGYILIQAIPPNSDGLEEPEIQYYTLHVKTLQVERLCMLNERISDAHLYTNFLPPLSLPSV